MRLQIIEDVVAEIFEKAADKNLLIRLNGSCGIYIACKGLQGMVNGDISMEKSPAVDFFLKEWREPRDIDFIALMDDKEEIEKIFSDMNFRENKRFLTSPQSSMRSIFYKESIKVDVFYNVLNFNQKIDLTLINEKINKNISNSKMRIGVMEQTIPITELLLQKLQILNPGRKDLVDAWWLLKENAVSRLNSNDTDVGINTAVLNYYSRNEWGFYYSIHVNFDRIIQLIIESYNSSEYYKKDPVYLTIKNIKKIIDNYPKGWRWKLRSKVGTLTPWYNVVEEII